MQKQRRGGSAGLTAALAIASLMLSACKDKPQQTTERVIGAPPAATGSARSSATAVSTGSAGFVKSDADCQSSRACQDFGACAHRDGRCYAKTDEGCRKSRFCERAGQCKAYQDRCVIGAESDADCQGDHGKAGRNPCKLAGKCTAKGGVCIASSSDDCQKSMVCTSSAKCTAKEGDCVLTSADDCKRSVMCKHNKQCLYKEEHGHGVCYAEEKEGHEGHGH